MTILTSVQKTRLAVFSTIVMDTFCSVTCSILAVLIIRWVSEPFGNLKFYGYFWGSASLFATIIGSLLMGTYQILMFHSSFRTVGKVLQAVAIKEFILLGVLLLGLLKVGTPQLRYLVLLLDFTLTVTILVCLRVLLIQIYYSSHNSPEQKYGRLVSLVCGTNQKSMSTVTRLNNSSHYNVLGYLTTHKEKRDKILGYLKIYFADNLEVFTRLRNNLGVECLIFPPKFRQDPDYAVFKHFCQKTGMHMIVIPDADEVDLSMEDAKDELPQCVDDKPKLKTGGRYISGEYIRDGMTPFENGVKRFVDFCLSALLLVVFSPLMLLCWIAIKCSDGGPVIYSQERIGRFGRPFKIYKFRSMTVDAEKDGPALCCSDNASRITKVGAFLRAHHLDELPQLWNVLIGDMAFVGPRPERKFFIDQIMEIDSRYFYLYQIRPGVTSYATFYNGYTDTMEKMLRRLDLDIYYLRYRSWWFDIKILGMTFLSIVFGKKF